MKNKLLIMLSLFVMALCATTLVACNRYNDEKLIAERVVSIEYGNPVDFEMFNVSYYKDGETHKLTLKGKKDPYGHYDNPDGDYTWEQFAVDIPKQLNVDEPEVGLYGLRLEYKNVKTDVYLEVKTATYPEVIAISADESTKYLGDKINISLSSEPERASINYRFSRCTNVTLGEEEYVDIGTLSKSQYETWSSNTLFMSMFHVGKYKVFAEITMSSYKPIVTEPVTFEVEKASLKGKYYIANQDATVKYVSDVLGDYSVPGAFMLQATSEDALPYRLTVNDYTLEWEDKEQVVGLSSEGIPVVLRFTSDDFTLNDTSDTKEVTLYIEQAEFPYSEVDLFVDGNKYESSAPYEYKEFYLVAVKVAKTYRSNYIDVPDTYEVTLLDGDDNEVDGVYAVSATDIARGYFVIKYEIVSKDGKYKTASGTVYVNIEIPEEPEPEPEPEP